MWQAYLYIGSLRRTFDAVLSIASGRVWMGPNLQQYVASLCIGSLRRTFDAVDLGESGWGATLVPKEFLLVEQEIRRGRPSC
jgi:hypothetical protein